MLWIEEKNMIGTKKMSRKGRNEFMSQILVSYFSASGVTRKVAEKAANIIGGNLFEIEPVNQYTSEDLDWTNQESRSSIEMKNLSSRPEVRSKVSNLSDYDTVLIGFPVWWDLAPTIVNTFIEENNLEDKKIYVFATSGGSGVENSFNTLKNTYRNLNFISAKRFSSNVRDNDVTSWIEI